MASASERIERAVHNRTMRSVDSLFEAMDKHQAVIEEDASIPSHLRIQIRDLHSMNQILYREVRRLGDIVGNAAE